MLQQGQARKMFLMMDTLTTRSCTILFIQSQTHRMGQGAARELAL